MSRDEDIGDPLNNGALSRHENPRDVSQQAPIQIGPREFVVILQGFLPHEGAGDVFVLVNQSDSGERWILRSGIRSVLGLCEITGATRAEEPAPRRRCEARKHGALGWPELLMATPGH
jgi:hypothetical protein